MSASLETTNYKLPIYTLQDPIAYIPDWNKAMREIDMQIGMNAARTDGQSSDIQNLTDLLTAQGSEVNTLTGLVNDGAIQALPTIQNSPGINFNWYGYQTNELVVAQFESSWSPLTYDDIIKRKYSNNFIQLQCASLAGDPFHSTIGTLEEPASRGFGICYVRETVESTSISHHMGTAYIGFAHIGNVTNIYLLVNPVQTEGYRNVMGDIIIVKNNF